MNNNTSLRILLSTTLCTLATLSQAAPPAAGPMVRTERNLSLELANQIASAAIAACRASGFEATVVVVDRSGMVTAIQRGDGSPKLTLDSAERKAITAAGAKVPTQMMAEMVQKDPVMAASLAAMPGVLLIGGGVPIKAGNDVIGAVGVGGAHDSREDNQCALAALDKVKDQLK